MKKLVLIINLVLMLNCCLAISPSTNGKFLLGSGSSNEKNIKDITSYSTGQITPLWEGRSDSNGYDSGSRIMENMFAYVQGPAVRRPGTRFIKVVGDAAIGEGSVIVPRHLERNILMQYFVQNGTVWGIPFTNNTDVLTLDEGLYAQNVGDGNTGFPCYLHPFEVGQTISISGSGNYSGGTVMAGTSTNMIITSENFNGAEQFDGTETVIRYINTTAGEGRMVMDSDNNLYVGTTGGVDERYIQKISEDFLTVDNSYFSPDGGWNVGNSIVQGLQILESGNNEYLYAWFSGLGGTNYLFKFDLSDGSQVWRITAEEADIYEINLNPPLGPVDWCSIRNEDFGSPPTYDMAIDASGEAYIQNASSTYWIATFYGNAEKSFSKFETADGTYDDYYINEFNPDCIGAPVWWTYTSGAYEIHIDNNIRYGENDPGVVILGGNGNYYVPQGGRYLYDEPIPDYVQANVWVDHNEYWPGLNLSIVTLGGTDGTSIRLGRDPIYINENFGGTYSTDDIYSSCITTHNGFIYVANLDNDTVYKLNSSLSILASVEIPHVDGRHTLQGILVDAFDRVTVVRQAIQGAAVYLGDNFWYYNDNLVRIGESNGLLDHRIAYAWAAGTVHEKGNFSFEQPVRFTSSSYDYTSELDYNDPNTYVIANATEARLVPFEHSVGDSYVLELGNEYAGFLRTAIIKPGLATSPSPTDTETEVSTSATLSWTAGSNTNTADVYFGTVSPGVLVSSNQSGTTYNPGELEYDTTYYWRIDGRNNDGITIGTVWSFTTGSASPTGSYSAYFAGMGGFSDCELEIELTGDAGNLTFIFKDTGTGSSEFTVDDNARGMPIWFSEDDHGPGPHDWTEVTIAIGAGTKQFLFDYTPWASGKELWLDNITFPNGTTEDFETGDFSKLSWIIDGGEVPCQIYAW